MYYTITYDTDADAVYIYLVWPATAHLSYDHGRSLDHRRRIDFAKDDSPLGIELLSVSKGITWQDLPHRESLEPLFRSAPFGNEINS